MGCGGTKHLCDNLDGMLDRLRVKIDQKEKYTLKTKIKRE